MSNIIYVFGSNEAGIHGAGAAKIANIHHGAVYGVGVGMSGLSYAIPTKNKKIEPLHLSIIENYVDDFLDFARMNRNDLFYLTPIGCGLAGFSVKDIAPMFIDAPVNVILPKPFRDEYLPIEPENRVIIYGGRDFGMAPEIPEHLLIKKFEDREYSPASLAFERQYSLKKMLEACSVCEQIVMGIGRKKNTTLISGFAKGADRIPCLMHEYFPKDYKDLITFPAKWREHGKKAGPIRNAQMITEGHPTFAIGFPGGSGTAHMKKILDQAGVFNVSVKEPKIWLDRFETLKIGK